MRPPLVGDKSRAIWWYRAVDPPVPIPHTVVTRRSTDPTEGATPWEHRPLPDRSFVFLHRLSPDRLFVRRGRREMALHAGPQALCAKGPFCVFLTCRSEVVWLVGFGYLGHAPRGLRLEVLHRPR